MIELPYTTQGITEDRSEEPAISWVLCAHVVDKQLLAALRSCFEQTFSDFECIVVANGIHADVVAKEVQDWFGHDDRLKIIKTSLKHLTFSLSLGLHAARAPLIARMDADDIATTGRLAFQAEYLSRHPDVDIVGSDYEIIDLSGSIVKTIKVPKSNEEIRKSLYFGNPICHPSVMFRKSAVLEVGGYLGDVFAQDYDLWCRLARDDSVVFSNVSFICVQYRSSGVGSARGARLAYSAMAASQLRNFLAEGRWRWLIGAISTAFKALFWARRP
jgi:glycosyltransferase involved in cell wall biosynthesis